MFNPRLRSVLLGSGVSYFLSVLLSYILTSWWYQKHSGQLVGTRGTSRDISRLANPHHWHREDMEAINKLT